MGLLEISTMSHHYLINLYVPEPGAMPAELVLNKYLLEWSNKWLAKWAMISVGISPKGEDARDIMQVVLVSAVIREEW